jgi:NAD-dependent dihydropyrimidine dehydrogenase PreA subunit
MVGLEAQKIRAPLLRRDSAGRRVRRKGRMAHVIVDTCQKDMLCIDSCPSDAIHPLKDEPQWEAEPQLYIHPEECMDCGACIATCPTNSIYLAEEVPADKQEFVAKNAAYYGK